MWRGIVHKDLQSATDHDDDDDDDDDLDSAVLL